MLCMGSWGQGYTWQLRLMALPSVTRAAARRYMLVTPMVDDERGSAVLVNRGWVPAAWKTDAQLRARWQPSGRVGARAPLLVPDTLYDCPCQSRGLRPRAQGTEAA